MSNAAAHVELGTKNVGVLLREYAIPGIIAMTAASLYNMVDSIYIGHIKDIGAYAISGLAVTFPLMNLSTALGTLVGVGASTMISVLLGQKNYTSANRVLANEVALNIIIGTIFAVLTLSFIEPILYFFGASENTLPFAKDYMSIILLGNVITHLYFGLNNCIRASGNPKKAMNLTIFTVVFNSILDPILIFGLDMGIKGAAIATIVSQMLALSFAWKYFMDKKNILHFPKGIFKLDWKIAKSSLEIGMGPFLMNSASSIVTLFINQQLRKYGGDLSLGAYGIVNRISFLFVMIVMGLNQGMQPIAGFNYGARQYKRVKEVYKLTALWATAVVTLGFVISEFLSVPTVSIFTNSPVLIEKSAHGLRSMNIFFPIVGFQMVATNFFQCLGMVKKSIILSLSRQLLLLVPMIYLLPIYYGVSGVWYSFPVADISSAILTLIMIAALFKKLNKLNDGDDPSILGSKI